MKDEGTKFKVGQVYYKKSYDNIDQYYLLSSRDYEQDIKMFAWKGIMFMRLDDGSFKGGHDTCLLECDIDKLKPVGTLSDIINSKLVITGFPVLDGWITTLSRDWDTPEEDEAWKHL